jgi:hypothetical protein
LQLDAETSVPDARADREEFENVEDLVVETEHGSFRLSENVGMLQVTCEESETWQGRQRLIVQASGYLLLATEPTYFESDLVPLMQAQG